MRDHVMKASDKEDKDETPEVDVATGLNFVKDNSVFIYGDFGDSIAKDVIPDLLKEIEKQSKLKDGKIKIYIDSNGGYTRYLFNMLAVIEDAKKKGIIVETYVFGYAYSCGSMLACAGSKGHRYISYLAEHLCHLGFAGAGASNDVELERGRERVQAHFDKVRNLYRKYANLKDLENVIKFDHYFIRGAEIIENGLADHFVD
jgi:ATP-dependent protease ClpP protease subunit